MSLLEKLNSNKVKLAGAIIIVIILVLLLPKGCEPDIVVPQDDARVIRDSFDAKIRQYEKSVSDVKDSLFYYKDLYDKQSQKVSSAEKKLVSKQREVLSLAAELEAVKTLSDTSEYSKKCDTLAAEIPFLVGTISSYRKEIDSLSFTHLKEREKSDSTISQLEAFNSDLRISFKSMENENNKNLVTIGKLDRKLRRKNAELKIAIGVGLGLLGVAIIK